ncbi:MAG: hypothetical protein Q4P78_06615 [Rothia sp. (in: high G+C Gram-positive bacteria)]|uniref:hypothetical protein n=1 Tax=Rothia sp. (in: high G+C Gram-positive bacteria) TaxID=1885016 RepID=UPI0026E0B940|nr:hypothetical protein [Rothia sp. (in: high G+C Gram-positive bacteria)]MDO5750857.1 hypothetical protein [Rothia sp. (in: high G+C Gram-positive bacteria)]
MSTSSEELDSNLRYNPKNIKWNFIIPLLFTAISIPIIYFSLFFPSIDTITGIQEFITKILISIKFEGYASIIIGALWAVRKDYDSIQKYSIREYTKYISLNILMQIILMISSISLSFLSARNIYLSLENFSSDSIIEKVVENPSEWVINAIGAYLFAFAALTIPEVPERIKYIQKKQVVRINSLENYLKGDLKRRGRNKFNPYKEDGGIKWYAAIPLLSFRINLILSLTIIGTSIYFTQALEDGNFFDQDSIMRGFAFLAVIYILFIFYITYGIMQDSRSKQTGDRIADRPYLIFTPILYLYIFLMNLRVFSVLLIAGAYKYIIPEDWKHSPFFNKDSLENFYPIIISLILIILHIFTNRIFKRREYQIKEAALQILKKEKDYSAKLLEDMEIPDNKDNTLEQKEDNNLAAEQKSSIFARFLHPKKDSKP